MTHIEIERDMKMMVGGSFISKKELATYMGYKKVDSVEKFLAGLERVNKKYFVPEVARRISNEVK